MVLHGLDTLPDYNTHSIPVDTLPDYKKSKVNNTPSVNNTPMVNNNMTSVNVTCTFRLNHTETTSNRQIMSLFDLAPDLLQAQIKQNWFLINLQNTFERCVCMGVYVGVCGCVCMGVLWCFGCQLDVFMLPQHTPTPTRRTPSNTLHPTPSYTAL